jgi:hypothetical protein
VVVPRFGSESELREELSGFEDELRKMREEEREEREEREQREV